ncbi:hypothetical protein BJV82DRAFT_626983 [Fennellomyces sp. T-0311]|nr:hypothetical protein BJV82DRAFT_626983 [Fennellomyces sp. T-0311]
MGSMTDDLDSSLDDIIKSNSKKQFSHKQPHQRPSQQQHNTQRRNVPPPRRPAQNRFNEQRPRSYSTHQGIHSIQPKSRTVGKPSILQRTNLPAAGGGFVKKSISTATLANRVRKTDPSQIVITKSVRRNEEAAPQQQQQQARGPVFHANNDSGVKNTSFNIRGLSGGISIRGESGPAIVVISNLDPGANAQDVKTACQQFGPVVRCDVLVDHAGRSFGEAEVEFSSKAAALDCVSKLDNEIADGRILRAVLRNRPSAPPPPMHHHHPHPQAISAGPANFASQTLRSVIAPTRSGYTSAVSGKMYSDQIMAAQPPPPQQQPLPPHPDFARFPATARRF